MSLVTERLDCPDQPIGIEGPLQPRNCEPTIGEIDARVDDTVDVPERVLDARNAAAAGDAYDSQLHFERAVLAGPRESGEIETLGHGTHRRPRRLLERKRCSPLRVTSIDTVHAPGSISALPRNWPGAVCVISIGWSRRASAGCSRRASKVTPDTSTPEPSRSVIKSSASPDARRVRVPST